MRYLKPLFLFLVLSCTLIAQANADFKGKVVRVIDGDTIEVLTTQKQKIRVRLIDIDAPERSQAYGNQSRKYLAQLIAGRIVSVQESKKDVYHRTLGVVFYGNTNINAKMVESGYAWAYRYKGVANNKDMVELETIAKQNKRGLWRDNNPLAPWDFRHNNRN